MLWFLLSLAILQLTQNWWVLSVVTVIGYWFAWDLKQKVWWIPVVPGPEDAHVREVMRERDVNRVIL